MTCCFHHLTTSFVSSRCGQQLIQSAQSFCFDFEWSQCCLCLHKRWQRSVEHKNTVSQVLDKPAAINLRSTCVHKTGGEGFIKSISTQIANGIAEFTSRKWPSQRNLHRLQTSANPIFCLLPFLLQQIE